MERVQSRSLLLQADPHPEPSPDRGAETPPLTLGREAADLTRDELSGPRDHPTGSLPAPAEPQTTGLGLAGTGAPFLGSGIQPPLTPWHPMFPPLKGPGVNPSSSSSSSVALPSTSILNLVSVVSHLCNSWRSCHRGAKEGGDSKGPLWHITEVNSNSGPAVCEELLSTSYI